MNDIRIGSKIIGEKHPTYIIAEMSGNHGGKIENALAIIEAAVKSGADAIKLQTYTADTITLDSSRPDFTLQSDSPWKASRTFYDLYKTAHTPWEWHAELFAKARKMEIDIFSSPFDETAVDLLEELGACAYKIASPEINHIPLLRRVAATKKPVIFSTGCAELADIELALHTLRSHGCSDIVILKCTTVYPAPPQLLNLKTIPDMLTRFGTLAGFSDHTVGSLAAITAVALGAKVIEKHFTLSEEDQTVDSFFSMHSAAFASMVNEVRYAEQCLGTVSYTLDPQSIEGANGMRSLYISSFVPAGAFITPQNIKCVRPRHGLHPKFWDEVLGKRVKRDLEPGERLRLEDLE